MKETLTLPRPACRVSVLDVPDRGWDLDIADLLAAESSHAARRTLAAIRARPANLDTTFPDDLRAAIRAGVAIEIENTEAMLDRFLDRIGGPAGFDQWSALVREHRRLARLRAEWMAEGAAVTAARLHPMDGARPSTVMDRSGRHGTPAALIAQAAWEAGVDPVECDPVRPDGTAAQELRGRIAPYLWGIRKVPWTGPQGIAEMARTRPGTDLIPWVVDAWRRQCPQEWEAEEAPDVPDLVGAVARWRDRTLDPADLEQAIARLAQRTGCATCERDPARLYAVFPQANHAEARRWCEETCLGLEQRMKDLAGLWREPVQPGVRQRLARRGIAVRTDARTGGVLWSQAGRDDPLGVLENGPFLTLELALEDIAARAVPGGPGADETEEIA